MVGDVANHVHLCTMYIHNCNRMQAAPSKPSDRTFKLDILNLRKSNLHLKCPILIEWFRCYLQSHCIQFNPTFAWLG
jgi:hypothetical protein